jgi:hypothetical protein
VELSALWEEFAYPLDFSAIWGIMVDHHHLKEVLYEDASARLYAD